MISHQEPKDLTARSVYLILGIYPDRRRHGIPSSPAAAASDDTPHVSGPWSFAATACAWRPRGLGRFDPVHMRASTATRRDLSLPGGVPGAQLRERDLAAQRLELLRGHIWPPRKQVSEG